MTGATAHIARTSMRTKRPVGQIQHRMPTSHGDCGNAREPYDNKAGSPKPKGQLAPTAGTGKGTELS